MTRAKANCFANAARGIAMADFPQSSKRVIVVTSMVVDTDNINMINKELPVAELIMFASRCNSEMTSTDYSLVMEACTE